jgi:PAS domain S-box-containing protein
MHDAPAAPLSDPARLHALRRTGLIDAASMTPAFDRLARLAGRLLNVPVALVTLVGEDRQFFVGCSGCADGAWQGLRETPLSHSFCRHVVEAGAPLVIEDAREHPLVRENPAVGELGVVAYAGIPLVTSGGTVLGSFCAIDHRPHAWSGDEVDALRDLTASVVTEVELRLTTAEAGERAEEARRERDEKLALLDSTAEGIYGIDNDGVCTFFNLAAAGMTRLEPEEVLGHNVHRLIHHTRPDGRPFPEEECPIYRALARGEGCRREGEVLWRADGTSFPAEYTSSPVIRDGRVRGAVVSFADITRRKQLEQLRDDLTHMIVHDLRTPLTSVLSGLQTLALTPLDASQGELLAIAVSGGETLLGLINDLLDVAKMESGTLALDYGPVRPAELAAEALRQVALLAREKGVTLEDASDAGGEGEVPVRADREKLLRTLVNLLGNAIKFTPPGGKVTLHAETDGGEVAGTACEARFSVTDTGEGIPEEALGRIFEKFGQVETRRSGRKMSTGLGLTFCRMAVEAHGGHIRVESEPGAGSTFSFTIPADRRQV